MVQLNWKIPVWGLRKASKNITRMMIQDIANTISRTEGPKSLFQKQINGYPIISAKNKHGISIRTLPVMLLPQTRRHDAFRQRLSRSGCVHVESAQRVAVRTCCPRFVLDWNWKIKIVMLGSQMYSTCFCSFFLKNFRWLNPLHFWWIWSNFRMSIFALLICSSASQKCGEGDQMCFQFDWSYWLCGPLLQQFNILLWHQGSQYSYFALYLWKHSKRLTWKMMLWIEFKLITKPKIISLWIFGTLKGLVETNTTIVHTTSWE